MNIYTDNVTTIMGHLTLTVSKLVEGDPKAHFSLGVGEGATSLSRSLPLPLIYTW